MKISFLTHPDDECRLGDVLNQQLSNQEWTHFRAAVAFLKSSGASYLGPPLREFARQGDALVAVGVDHGGTSYEALVTIREALGERGRLVVSHNRARSTFHPKVYLFYNAIAALAVIGSGNLTKGGLFENYEAFLVAQLDRTSRPDEELFQEISRSIQVWSDTSGGLAQPAEMEAINEWYAAGLVPNERESRQIQAMANGRRRADAGALEQIARWFEARQVTPAPPPLPSSTVPDQERDGGDLPEPEEEFPQPEPTPWAAPQGGRFRTFVMTLQKTDVGVGQTTHGTSRRSPEIFIPLGARNLDPEFWGWPNAFEEDPVKPGKYDRRDVKMRLGGAVISVNMMTWPDKHDFRIRSESLRSAGNIGDILKIEATTGRGGFSYYVEIIPTDSAEYEYYSAFCQIKAKGKTEKRYGYL